MTKKSADFGRRIKQMRKAAGLTQKSLAEACGCSRQHIQSIEAGMVELPSREILAGMARGMGVPVEELLKAAGYLKEVPAEAARDAELERRLDELQRQVSQFGTVLRHRIAEEFPVYGSVPAGLPETETGEVIDKISFSFDYIYIRISGDSLVGLGIEPGDVVVVDPYYKEPRGGTVAVVRLLSTGEVTIKRFYREGDHVRLEPANSKYKAIDATNVEVIGIVIMSIKRFASP